MAEILLTEVTPLADDVLSVKGFVDGAEVEAQGWQSALTNHYDASAYAEDGHRDPKAQPRALIADEAGAYLRGLLAVAASVPVEEQKPDAHVESVLAAVKLDQPPPEPAAES